MTSWLLETLLWTGLLLGAVLLLRRPVARHFGPQAAYALWFLPMLRLVMPPITLPAWMNPAPAPAIADSLPVAAAIGPAELAATPAAVAASESAALPFDLVALLLATWLVGAGVFLVARFRAYFEMRRELLAEARQVGTLEGGGLGPVRLVETPATNAPLAFGVMDRVIAVPQRFLAMAPRPMRDLALAHELAHHRGGDLIVNFAVQPLFALHWFNPLGWVGWRALRRDQEAACDARVVGAADAELRATYAQTIAGFAAGPRVALAAPMACPVLGDKSIIHRLRSLAMTDISARRRWAGRSLLLAGALALPLTASISYAEATQDAPQAPAPPAAPAAPSASQAPTPPEAPAAPEARAMAFAEDSDEFEFAFGEEGEDGKKVYRKVVIRQDGEPGEDGETYVYKTKDADGNVKVEKRRVKRVRLKTEDGRELTPEEYERHMEKHIEKKMERHEKRMEAMGERLEKRIEKRFGEGHEGHAHLAKLDCDETKGHASKVTTEDGAFKLAICAKGMAKEAMAAARTGLKEARAKVAADAKLSDEKRAAALQAIDAEIARLEKEG